VFQPFFIVTGICSILIGSFCAIYQDKIKRFLGYTSIVQVGYIMLGLATCSINGFIGAYLHLTLYAGISLGFFAILINSNNIITGRNAVYFQDLHEYVMYTPMIGSSVLLLIMGMGAFPPIGTFFSKAYIYIILLDSKLELIAFLAIISNLISYLYYIKILQDIFFVKTKELPQHHFYGLIFEPNALTSALVRVIGVLLLLFVVFAPLGFSGIHSIATSCV